MYTHGDTENHQECMLTSYNSMLVLVYSHLLCGLACERHTMELPIHRGPRGGLPPPDKLYTVEPLNKGMTFSLLSYIYSFLCL